MQKRFEAIGEFYAAGLFEEPDRPYFIRFSRALRRYFEQYRLPPYNGQPLYPYGSKSQGLSVNPDYSFTVGVNWKRLQETDEAAAEALNNVLSCYRSQLPPEHVVGGNMYTHSHPNFRRIIREGLDSYEERVKRIADVDIREGLLDLLAGIRCFHTRIVEKLKAEAEDSELYRALLKVPFQPAETLYEAMVCWNFVYYLDGCDNIGRLDADLIDYYRGEDITELLKCFFQNADVNNGWSGSLGPDYNALTLQCVKAVKGFRRPSLELRITSDMPQELWDAALDSISAGGGSPSLYREDGYQNALKRLFPDIPQKDRLCFSGGGCTETMLVGMSNVGSLDAGINVAWIFEKVMRQHLPSSDHFDDFYQVFMDTCRQQIDQVLLAISASQKLRAQYRPHPMRTLLIDDCIDRGKDFNNGGARYYWSVVNLAGLINVLDSLLVIRQLVFIDRVMSGSELLDRMDAGETFLNYPNIPRHGQDLEEANDMAKRLSTDLCAVFEGKVPYLGGAYLPSSIQFVTYTAKGKLVGATPDGRAAGDPLCDSIGAIHGNDKLGATALLNSAAALCQETMAGTPVLNVKMDPSHLSDYAQALVKGYFQSGGMQMQITCVKKEDLLDAKEHPEKYPNLIVRIGGYSEYFSRLTPELRQTVIDRTLYGM